MTLPAGQAVPIALLVPFALAALLGLLGSRARVFAPWLALLAPLTVLGVGASSIVSGAYEQLPVPWISSGGSVIDAGFATDPLSALMLVVVGVVASAVIVFSIGYMHGDRGFARYFALLALFTGAMTSLVLAESLVSLFIGWELVGACSYLLIGFWYEKPSAAEAARKAFLVTRVGDVGFMLGIAVVWAATGTVRIPEVLAAAESLPASVATLSALLLFAGAAGKSAQFPLHTWLPDAMEGPTPVSALIHAATMVAAGVFLVARMWPLFEASQAALTVILAIGTFTALGAATIAIAQRDIKKVLAYSTISQLGLMFAALGAGAWGAAMFHLVTHAAFKALLFLSAGSVIHGSGTQDLREMGGLARRMPVTAACWIAGSLALAGVPPLSGFFSKDAVIASVLHESTLAGAALVLASVLTAAYMARATRLAFFGESRSDGHAHETGVLMAAPLVVLALIAVGGGMAQRGVEELLGLPPEELSLVVAGVSVAAAVIGLAAGWLAWRRPDAEESFAPALARTWAAARAGYGYDALLLRAVARPAEAVSRGAYRIVDRRIVDRLVEAVGSAAHRLGAVVSALHDGDAQRYAALLGIGVVAAVALSVALGRW